MLAGTKGYCSPAARQRELPEQERLWGAVRIVWETTEQGETWRAGQGWEVGLV